MLESKTILVAPLNWGLGHAARCIPIIQALLDNQFKVLLASDGRALSLLRKEFPQLPYKELPAYNITYPKNKRLFKLQLLLKSPGILKAAKQEKKLVKQWVMQGEIHGIISDNRLGLRHPAVHSVFITHQLRVLSGNTTTFSSLLHQRIISKFNSCWVPDWQGKPNLSGRLGHPENAMEHVEYIGPVSRFSAKPAVKKYDYLVLLSGPEPQRSLLEQKLFAAFKDSQHKVLFVLGKTEVKQQTQQNKNITVVNYLTSHDLENALNASEAVVTRSGYTTVMDLVHLKKKALFIPTPGQYEQLYLAKRLAEQGLYPYVTQDKFSLNDLKKIKVYKGVPFKIEAFNLGALFTHF